MKHNFNCCSRDNLIYKSERATTSQHTKLDCGTAALEQTNGKKIYIHVGECTFCLLSQERSYHPIITHIRTLTACALTLSFDVDLD